MSTFVSISLLAGMVLGQRFKVLALLPALGIVLLTTIVAEIAGADRWPTLLIAAAAGSSLQIGYVAGYGIRRLIAAAHSGWPRPSVVRSRPGQHSAFEGARKNA